jgi:hypothetical protein
MGFDLTSESGADFQVRSSYWTFLLYLAQEYGWEMEGTQAPDGVDQAEWDGGYASNDGQVVSKKDASSFADALERAVVDPNRAQAARRLSKQIAADVRSLAQREGIELDDYGEADLYEVDEDGIRDLVHFCRQGSFRVG